MDLDIAHLKTWIGKTRESRDVISPRLANSLAAILDEAPALTEGDLPPVGIHWCLSPDIARMSRLGPDGHPARGDFLPPIPLPRRMWAGGELVFSGEFLVGDEVIRRSRITDIALKTGRSGTLCFVTVTHDYLGPRGLVLNERHDIVYRPLDTSAERQAPEIPLPEPMQTHVADASPVLLARYSAVTFNGHRIHYDRDYCQREEGYPGLLVHGPLQATFLLRLASRMNGGRPPNQFTFRGVSPLFDGHSFSINAGVADNKRQFWICSSNGSLTMHATVNSRRDL